MAIATLESVQELTTLHTTMDRLFGDMARTHEQWLDGHGNVSPSRRHR